jgi:hypothetical protein
MITLTLETEPLAIAVTIAEEMNILELRVYSQADGVVKVSNLLPVG